jgi:hypothetical protein
MCRTRSCFFAGSNPERFDTPERSDVLAIDRNSGEAGPRFLSLIGFPRNLQMVAGLVLKFKSERLFKNKCQKDSY